MAMDELIQELHQAVEAHVIPVFQAHGLGDPYFFIEERQGGRK